MSSHPRASRQARDRVFERDGYRCTNCGHRNMPNNPLTVHHKKPRFRFPELINDVDNMITLCLRCHRELEQRKHGG